MQTVQNYPLLPLFPDCPTGAYLGGVQTHISAKVLHGIWTFSNKTGLLKSAWCLAWWLTYLTTWKRGVGPNCMENEENFGLEWCWMALWIERLASAPSCLSYSQESCNEWLCPGEKQKPRKWGGEVVLNCVWCEEWIVHCSLSFWKIWIFCNYLRLTLIIY